LEKKIIIVGNGLGMAIDPEHFSLTNALKKIWDKPDLLTEYHKELINKCTKRNDAPEYEEELDDLHLAITSCKTLNRIGSGEIHWLSDYGQEFPEVTARYIHKVATYLHNSECDLPSSFEKPLIDFIKKTKSHVATLNYDKLLYSLFIKNDVFKGYNGVLIDGITNKGFKAENMERKYEKTFGYYLHLHGSPLFIDSDSDSGSTINKLARKDLTLKSKKVGEHIVLTHVKHKPEVIASSYILRTYWNYLRFSLSEVEEVILFGYSGEDNHLNELIRPYLSNKTVRIVEWSDAGKKENREEYWKEKLGSDFTLVQLENITEFTDW